MPEMIMSSNKSYMRQFLKNVQWRTAETVRVTLLFKFKFAFTFS